MSLATLLTERIRAHGPISVAEFMAESLGHPQYGYYMGRDPFGVGGDFTTAPEISQIFGELIGLWCAIVWQSMGSPARVVLAEIGPGRGTLMADLLRAARTLPPFFAAIEAHLVETSPALRNRQAQTLANEAITWAERFEDLPEGPLLLVANELLDALPIRQFEKRAEGWVERLVGLDEGGAFVFVLGDKPTHPPLSLPIQDAPVGAIAELCQPGRDLATAIGRRLAVTPGAALFIDYGSPNSGTGDTLQAVKGHAYHPALSDPGHVDLTAHVDFQAMAEAGIKAGAMSHGPVSQGRFLLRLGIEERAVMLMRNASAEQAADMAGCARRLIDPGEMGTLFQVLALASPALPTPPGLDP
jgi:SAM-dependent MidA family methyltransferase